MVAQQGRKPFQAFNTASPRNFFIVKWRSNIESVRKLSLSKLFSVPIIAKIALKFLKRRAFKPFEISLERAKEKQRPLLEAKFRKMERTEIGRKIGIRRGAKLQDLPITDYAFYKPFFNNPSPSAFMYPLEEYVKVRTSGTAGTAKWYMFPRKAVIKAFRQSAVLSILAIFHDGEKITLEYGDSFYINLGPAPFISGTMISLASTSGSSSFLRFMPNLNLPFKDKVQYFISNHDKIDGALILASVLVNQVIPAIGEPIKLKGLAVPDTIVGEIYRDEIENFFGTPPKTAYGSTETMLSTIPSVQHPLGFFLDWRRGIFEFRPIIDEEVRDTFVSIDEVEVGGVYQPVYTDFETELTRFNVEDSFKCVAKGDDILGVESPIFKFHARLENTVAIQNFTRLSEGEILNVIRESGIKFIDFTARMEVEQGLEYLALYIECHEEITAEAIVESLHKQLYRIDGDYRDLVDFMEYIPIKVYLVPRGVYTKYLEEKVGTYPKVTRVNMKERDFRRFLQLMERVQKNS